MTDEFAAEGFVVLAIGWQTFRTQPALTRWLSSLCCDSIAYLSARADVDSTRIGLTGFCAGGRYTMLFMPQIDAFGAGVAWYGFPNSGDPATPADLVDELEAPMLIIHGTARPSQSDSQTSTPMRRRLAQAGAKILSSRYMPMSRTASCLKTADLSRDEVANDAFEEMVTFFRRKLGIARPLTLILEMSAGSVRPVSGSLPVISSRLSLTSEQVQHCRRDISQPAPTALKS